MPFWHIKVNNMKFLQVHCHLGLPLKNSAYWLMAFFLLTGCRQDRKRDIRDYYFPLNSLSEGMVYEYEAVYPDSLAPYYWYYRSVPADQQMFLTGTYYEVDLIPRQLIREEMVGNGMLLEELSLFHTDSLGKQQPNPVKILAGNTFPFYVSLPGGVFLYRIEWQDPSDSSTTTTLIKNRRYLGDTTFLYKNKEYDCVAFEVKELVEVENEGVLEQQFAGVEFYAKGVGLVYVRKQVSEQLSFAYALTDRYPMDTLEQKFLKVYGEQ